MNKTQKAILIILGIAVVLFLLWFFKYLVICGLISLVLSSIGKPLMNLLSKFRYKNFKLGNGTMAGITLICIILTIFILFYLFVPMIASQASAFSQINPNQLLEYYREPIQNTEYFLREHGIIDSGSTFETIINNQLINVFKLIDYKSVANTVFSLAGEVLLGIFIVFFITFFLLKETHLFSRIILILTPNKHTEEVKRILDNSQRLISRYFIGLCCEILLLTTLLAIGFTLFGFSNAILMAFCCGILVIIPYIGAIIGGLLGLLICITSVLSIDPSVSLFPIILKFAGIFFFAKLADDFILQPFIYSKSVKAHPLEIFLVILMAGEIGGILGMILAIPTYTLIRTIAKEFFSNSKLVKSLTQNI